MNTELFLATSEADRGTYAAWALMPVETDAAVCESLLGAGVPDAVELAAWNPAALYPRPDDLGA